MIESTTEEDIIDLLKNIQAEIVLVQKRQVKIERRLVRVVSVLKELDPNPSTENKMSKLQKSLKTASEIAKIEDPALRNRAWRELKSILRESERGPERIQ